MSDYVIKGQISDKDARLVVIDETDWSVEVDESPIPNYDSYSGRYYVEVTNSKKLVFTRKTDGQIKAYGNVDPIAFWDDKTSDTYWQTNPFVPSYLDPVWNGSAWEVTNSGTGSQTAQLMVKLTSDWNENYKPYYAKVEYTLSGGGDVESIGFLGDASGRDTVSSTSAEEQASGTGILMLKIWQARDNIKYLSIRIPAGTTLTITGIYFSTLKFSDYVCDGYSYSQNAFDNATSMTGTEPDFSAALEIYGTTSRIYTTWGSYASSYKYHAATFTVSSTDPLNITVESSTPKNPPKVSIFSDRTTYLIGNNESGSGWLQSGTETVSFDWTPPSAGTYAVMVYNNSTLDWGKQCDTFTVTIAEGNAVEPTPGCEGYSTISEALDNTVSGTKIIEEEWNVEAQSHLAVEYGSNLGGTVDVSATAPTAFTVSFMEQTPSEVQTPESYVSDEYWGLGGGGTQNGTGENTTWTAAQWQAGEDWEFYLEHWGGSGDGSWRYGFRPDAVRITFTGGSSGIYFEVQNDGYAIIVEGTSISSGDTITIPLPWNTGGGENADIASIRFVGPDAGGSFTVTDIEFISTSLGPLEWSLSEEVDSSTNGSNQEVIDSFTPSTSEDWRLVLSNNQVSCVSIDMAVTHSGSAGATWLDYTSNFYWGPGDGTYNNGSWDALPYYGGGMLNLNSSDGTDSGDWADGFQPKQFRITFTGNTVNYGGIQLYDGSGGMRDDLESGVAYPLSFAHPGDYIMMVRMNDYFEVFTITSIEFSNDDYVYPCQAWSGWEEASEESIPGGDWDSEATVTIEDGAYGAVRINSGFTSGDWTYVTVVNEDNSATSGFTVRIYDGNGTYAGQEETTFSDTAGGTLGSIAIDGGELGPFPPNYSDGAYIVIYNSGGSGCEEFSINMQYGS